MRKEDIRELKLMEEVSKNEGITTQRELARRLNISLGLVNAFIKRVVRKGYFKVTTMPGYRVRYLLTPKGLAEKSRLTVDHLRYSLSYYREIRLRLQELTEELRAREIRRVALIGTGDLAELLYLFVKEAGIEITQVVSSRDDVTHFMGCPVEPLAALKNGTFGVVCLTELNENSDKVLEFLEALGVPRERILVSPGMKAAAGSR